MAARDYYNATPYDAPLPPIPTSSPQGHRPHKDTHTVGVPSQTSPFDDHAYPAYPRPSERNPQSPYSYPNDSGSVNTSYHGAGYKHDHADPFSDHNAMEMHSHHSKHDGGLSPTGGNAAAEGQYVRDSHRHSSRRDSGKGRRRTPWYKGRIPFAVYTLTLIQCIIFVVEIIRSSSLTGSPIQIRPTFNPMIGPSPYVLINMGARYVPCMRNTVNVTDALATGTNRGSISFPCPNTTTTDTQCSLSELCGFGGVPNPRPGGTMDDKPEPNQWFRFIIPIFLHGGIIHIGFNMLLQCTLGREIELQIGALRFLLVYFSSGIFGFVFGGNFAPNGIMSTGASGALFGILALTLIDLFYTWGSRKKPLRDLAFLTLEFAVSFVLGLLPGLDNFSHIGGFLMGLVCGICILRSPDYLRKRTGMDEPPYSAVDGAAVPLTSHGRTSGTNFGADTKNGLKAFAKQPVGFFKGRKPLWWVWWLVRAGALAGIFAAFIVLLNNFYVYRTQCQWCRHLSCLPIKNWCDIGKLEFQDKPPQSAPTTAARMMVRDLFGESQF